MHKHTGRLLPARTVMHTMHMHTTTRTRARMQTQCRQAHAHTHTHIRKGFGNHLHPPINLKNDNSLHTNDQDWRVHDLRSTDGRENLSLFFKRAQNMLEIILCAIMKSDATKKRYPRRSPKRKCSTKHFEHGNSATPTPVTMYRWSGEYNTSQCS